VTTAKDPAVPRLSPLQQELLSLLCCPEDHSDLTGWNGYDLQGALVSASGRAYPVRDGIPCLLPDALRNADVVLDTDKSEVAEKRREMKARDEQVVHYDAMLGLRWFTSGELPLSLRYLYPDRDHLMLEGGCGTGRMTPGLVDAVRGLVAVDFSLESLLVAKTKLSPEQRSKVLFVQADLSKLPLRTEVFDRVGSFGVYEHIPSEATRAAALTEMARVLKPRELGGRFALSAYRWGPPQSWISEKEGHHDGGIYFKRFTASELRQLASETFHVHALTETLLYYHLLWGRKRG
jgi:SAM-dependent methyltransferase